MSKVISGFEKELSNRKIQAGKRKVLLASLHLFAEKGFHAATIDDISKKGQISVGTIYKYFDSKDAILTALLSPLLNDIKDNLFVSLKKYESLDDLTDYLITNRLLFAKQNIDFIKILIQEILVGENVGPAYHQMLFGEKGLLALIKKVSVKYPEINPNLTSFQMLRIIMAPIAGLIVQQESEQAPGVTKSDLLLAHRQIMIGLTGNKDNK